MRNKCGRTFLVYLGIAIFCVLFDVIYEQFSYGEYSDAMRLMFCFPLIGGALPFLIMYLTKAEITVCRVAYNLWNSGIAVLICGCLIKGIIEISGRTTDYDIIYWILGGLMLLVSIFVQLMRNTVEKT